MMRCHVYEPGNTMCQQVIVAGIIIVITGVIKYMILCVALLMHAMII
jgi:hypothetical protein